MGIVTYRKNLGQKLPGAGIYEDLFECPAASDAVCSTLIICNHHTGQSTVSVKNSLNGDISTNAQLILTEVVLEAKETMTFTLGICLAEGDKLEINSDTGNVSFNLYGQLNTDTGS